MDTSESIVREEGRSDPVSAGRVRTGVVERVAFCAMSQRESRTGAAWRRGGVKASGRLPGPIPGARSPRRSGASSSSSFSHAVAPESPLLYCDSLA